MILGNSADSVMIVRPCGSHLILTLEQTNNKLRKFTSASSTYREKYKKNDLQNLQPLNTFKE